uniref:Uncharacterized protein n=1 Tax=Globisporangium ultimum (strain ATCC 200006 / CBS 805.95 / DAOM BR144) TaxID=431595 RepID=K3W9S4_GLOUD
MADMHATALDEDADAVDVVVDVDAADREAQSQARHRLSLQTSRSSESLSESEDGYVPHNQVVARSKDGTAVFYLFSHQAGGHKPFLRSANGEVCKPAIPLEVQFYTCLETKYAQLKPFVPPFCGLATVELMLPSLAPPPKIASSASSGDLKRLGSFTRIDGEPKSPVKVLPKVPLPNGRGKKRQLIKKYTGGGNPSSSSASPSGYSAKLWRKERNKRKAGGISRSNSMGPFKDILFA